MNKKIVLVGPAASGKDYLKNHLVLNGYTNCVMYTTRPARKGEIPGKDYNYISKKKFIKLIKKDFFYQYSIFNGWYYGIPRKKFKKSNLVVLSPDALSKLSKKIRKKCLVIYINCNEELRKNRLSERNDADIVERRLLADNSDFLNFKNYDIMLTDFKINYEFH